MAIPNPEAVRKKLDSIGVAEAKKRLEAGAYAANKIPIVKAWLEEQTGQATTGAPLETKTLAERYVDRLKNHPLIAIVVIVAVVAGAAADFSEAIERLADIVPGISTKTPTLPQLPGGTGWLLLGDLDPKGERFVRGPFYVTEASSYPDKSLLPRKGELLRLLAERNVVLPAFKTSGLSKQFLPPWQLNVLSDADYVGLKLPKHAIVEVRDVSMGSFRGEPIVVWVRVGAPPK